MKILGVSGSKRKYGNTATLVNEALKAAEEYGVDTQMVYLGDYNINGCTGCEGCKQNYRCVVKDDMQKLYQLLEESDGVILGSPTYLYNVTADMKAFLERLYCYEAFDDDDRAVWLSVNEVIGIKYGAVIAVCEQDNENDMGFTADAMALTLQASGYRVVDKVKILHLFKKGEAQENDEALAKARRAGEKLAKTLKLREDMLKKLNK